MGQASEQTPGAKHDPDQGSCKREQPCQTQSIPSRAVSHQEGPYLAFKEPFILTTNQVTAGESAPPYRRNTRRYRKPLFTLGRAMQVAP